MLSFVVIATIAPLVTPLGRTCMRDLGLTAATADAHRDIRNPAFWEITCSRAPDSRHMMPRAGFSPIPLTAEASGTLLGTTSQGYDIYYGLMWGARTAFRIGVLVVGIGLVVGILVGATAAYSGGLGRQPADALHRHRHRACPRSSWRSSS